MTFMGYASASCIPRELLEASAKVKLCIHFKLLRYFTKMLDFFMIIEALKYHNSSRDPAGKN